MSNNKVPLSCEICRSKNYQKNKSNDKRLEIAKYCKKCNTKTLHKEER